MAQLRMEDSRLVFKMLMAGDGNDNASPRETGCVLLLSVCLK